MYPIDSRGEGNQGSLIAIVLLVLALFAVFFLWQRDEGADDAELEIDIDGGAMTLESEGLPPRPGAPPGWIL